MTAITPLGQEIFQYSHPPPPYLFFYFQSKIVSYDAYDFFSCGLYINAYGNFSMHHYDGRGRRCGGSVFGVGGRSAVELILGGLAPCQWRVPWEKTPSSLPHNVTFYLLYAFTHRCVKNIFSWPLYFSVFAFFRLAIGATKNMCGFWRLSCISSELIFKKVLITPWMNLFLLKKCQNFAKFLENNYFL